MACVYDRTESLLIATLMHTSLIVATVTLVPPTTGGAFLTWFLIFTAVLWVLVAVAVVAKGGQLSHARLIMESPPNQQPQPTNATLGRQLGRPLLGAF